MATKIDDLKHELTELRHSTEAVVHAAQEEKRELTGADDQLIDANMAEADLKLEQLFRLERVERFGQKLEETPQRLTIPADVDIDQEPQRLARREVVTAMGPNGPITESLAVQPTARTTSTKFESAGHYAQALAYHQSNRGTDPRLQKYLAPSTYGSEGTAGDGGYAVADDFRAGIEALVMGESSLLSRTDMFTTSSNALVFPKDESTPWGTTGVQAYWGAEAGQMTQSKPALEQNRCELNKLYCLVPVTEELLEDAPALGQYLTRKVAETIDFKISLAIIRGTGVGTPLGVLNAGSTVSVAKEGSQTADTVVYENIVKMWSRLYSPNQANAVWLHNPDVFQSLATMSFEGSSSSVPAYMPAGGLSGSPFGSLMGRPAIPHQVCETLGDLGDIFLVDLNRYQTAVKGGGLRSDTSMHLFFDYDMTAFRFIMRIGGQPWYTSAITPRDGSNTLSPYVTLAERA